MNKETREKFIRELDEVVARISTNRTLLHAFFVDLLTPGEYDEMAVRWQIVKQLVDDVSQRDIVQDLGVAIGTVSRGSRMLLNPNGGFNKVLQKLRSERR